jgi:hypothetical protein
MPSGTCSRRAVFAGAITPVASLVGIGSLPAADRLKLAAPRLHARFRQRSVEQYALFNCYDMAMVGSSFPDGMTGEPI